MISARVSTVMLRGGIERAGVGAGLQALGFFAVVVLMAVPFIAAPWYLALVLALAATFLNPTMFFVSRNNAGTLYSVLPILNVIAIAGAAYFAVRVVSLLSRGYGDL
jgi:energy-coupling factor transporter transmembrane protein EcfT